MPKPQCANPECSNRSFALGGNHWVQIDEVRLAGTHVGEGPTQHLFAAVTCSKRCAVAVLTAELPAEEAAREEERALFQRFSDVHKQ